MKTLLIAFLTLLGMSVIAPEAEAGDRYRYGYGYRSYPRYRYYGYTPRYYSRPVRYYYNGYCYPRYYYGAPGITLRFNF